MTKIDTQRLERLQKKMAGENLAALVCRLPENVVYLTDYWPHHGFSVAVLPREGKPMLFLPEVELDYSNPDWTDTMPFGWGLLKDGDLYENYQRLLTQASQKLGLKGKRVGVEQSFEVVAPTYRTAEPVVPAKPWADLLAAVFADASLVDITGFIQEVRAVKSDYELGKMRIANEIAESALNKVLGQAGTRHDRSRCRGDGRIPHPRRWPRLQGCPPGARPVRSGRWPGRQHQGHPARPILDLHDPGRRFRDDRAGHRGRRLLVRPDLHGSGWEAERPPEGGLQPPARGPAGCRGPDARRRFLLRSRSGCPSSTWKKPAWANISSTSPDTASGCATTSSFLS